MCVFVCLCVMSLLSPTCCPDFFVRKCANGIHAFAGWLLIKLNSIHIVKFHFWLHFSSLSKNKKSTQAHRSLQCSLQCPPQKTKNKQKKINQRTVIKFLLSSLFSFEAPPRCLHPAPPSPLCSTVLISCTLISLICAAVCLQPVRCSPLVHRVALPAFVPPFLPCLLSEPCLSVCLDLIVFLFSFSFFNCCLHPCLNAG